MHKSDDIVMNASILMLTPNGAYFKSPTSHSLNQEEVATPKKVPGPPHPSPINMDLESLNSNTNETFRLELLKACQLKIPEAFAGASNFDGLFTKLSSTEGDTMSVFLDLPPDACPPKKAKLEDIHPPGDEITTRSQADGLDFDQCSTPSRSGYLRCDPDASASKVHSADVYHCSKNGKETCEIAPPNGSILGLTKGGKREHFQSPNLETRAVVRTPILRLNGSRNGAGQSVFYDRATDHLEISRLLNADSRESREGRVSSDKSPCSDKMSTVAVCNSDISDEDLVARDKSEDFDDYEEVEEDEDSRPPKKQQTRSAIRRFLSWRRCLKFRKRAASLDESKFPFLANRFHTYKTEFEFSV